ncbi:hypothetical protein KTAU_42190 [Thermogemmatispora aurantia]|uniref:Uncharacterized protein n=1 Tax=Thermogemmatispora aurantia TaxID=2045279 RepID=A0A5J4KE28_9CHLR|nr:hypothetical protein KTAU_42190 [Thermogemmatispora aurantia]
MGAGLAGWLAGPLLTGLLLTGVLSERTIVSFVVCSFPNRSLERLSLLSLGGWGWLLIERGGGTLHLLMRDGGRLLISYC